MTFNIQVSLHDGVITLDGNVRSWAEKRAVVGAVSHAPDMPSVHDHLQIRMVACGTKGEVYD